MADQRRGTRRNNTDNATMDRFQPASALEPISEEAMRPSSDRSCRSNRSSTAAPHPTETPPGRRRKPSPSSSHQLLLPHNQPQSRSTHHKILIGLMIAAAVGVQVCLPRDALLASIGTTSVAGGGREAGQGQSLKHHRPEGTELLPPQQQSSSQPHPLLRRPTSTSSSELTLDDLLKHLAIHPRPFHRRSLLCRGIPEPPSSRYTTTTTTTATVAPSTEIWFLQTRQSGWLPSSSSSSSSSTTGLLDPQTLPSALDCPTMNLQIHNSPAHRRGYDFRDPHASFLWSIVSDPFLVPGHRTTAANTSNGTSQSITQVQQLAPQNCDNLTVVDSQVLQSGSPLSPPPPSGLLAPAPENHQWVAALRSIVQTYDFLGVADRWDESFVALQLLLGLEDHLSREQLDNEENESFLAPAARAWMDRLRYEFPERWVFAKARLKTHVPTY